METTEKWGKSEYRHETVWWFPTLLAQPSPIGTGGRIQRHYAVPLFVPVVWLTGGGTLGRVVLPTYPISLSRCLFLPSPQFHPSPTKYLGTAAVRNVRNKRKKREIEYSVRGDGDPQKPAKSPCEGFACSRGYEFGEFQARREKSDQRRGNLRLDGNGDGQREKPGNQAKHCEQNETEQLALGHRR